MLLWYPPKIGSNCFGNQQLKIQLAAVANGPEKSGFFEGVVIAGNWYLHTFDVTSLYS
jgi:hypothetical protein